MPHQSENAKPRGKPLLRRIDQICLAALLGSSLAMMAAYALYERRVRGGLIEIESQPREPLTLKVDVNRAPWPELALLPGVGEALAKAIVDSREQDGPFRRAEDLRRVRGIGPKTLDKIRPYLFPLSADEVAESAAAGKP